ncbi:fatty acid synthase [Ramaria rubella]|nr:fatty acid synthase [Ramaria rubella]
MSSLNGNAIHGEEQSITTRPLVIQLGRTRIVVPVSAKPWDWIAAEILREEFLHSTDNHEAVDVADELEGADTQPDIELLTKFLGFSAAKVTVDPSPNYISILLSALRHFTTIYLTTKDVHSLVASYDTTVRKDVLTGYYSALAALESHVEASEVPRPPQSALFRAALNSKASIYALFGGQGTNEVYFDELQALYDIYKPYVSTFIAAASRNVLMPLVAKAELDGFTFYHYGLDILAWLDGTTPRPSVEYLASIPISFPLIGLTQLTQYLISTRVANLTPGEMRNLLGGATGHSQGIVSAVVISASATLDAFFENTEKALKWLFYSGLRGQESFPVLSLEPSIVQDSIEGGEGTPSPMLAITGLPLSEVQKFITKTNSHLSDNSQLFVSLHNGPRAFVVTGPARSLYGLVTGLRKVRAPSGLDQSKIPFSQRKAVFSVRFLVVNVPYHSEYLKDAAAKMVDIDLRGEELWTPDQLKVAVYHTQDGSDLRKLSTSLTRSLCDQIFTQPIHWTEATRFPPTATHAVDFGPGGLSGIGSLTARNLEGRGVRVIVVGEKGKGGSELYDAEKVKFEEWWSKKFAPRLVRTSDGKVHIDTPFSRLLGKPPIMVAGMTPSTVKAGFVSAVLSAGYHVELAGGGHYNAAAVRAKVTEIQAQIPAGVGLTLNALYINPRQFSFQLPLWQEMRREGLPIEGFCVAAGIPSTEKAAEIISGLRDAGIKHVSFKPGSVDGIRQVVNIAASNPDFPVILQWTGGRAGGHHSCEDFHQPILATYGSIRQQSNIALVAGSGFGGADDFFPYLTGEWSVERYGVQAMPFDGLLFASRVMIAKEAHTSSSVKDLIVAAPGVDDGAWEGTYTKETGGILTVRSELGEPIHKIATRAVKLWKEFDDTVFNLPKEKRAAWLKQNRDYVVSKLNKDFSKPWFGEKKDGTVVYDLGDMTYEEVTLRLLRLMFVSHQSRWIDITLRNLMGDWLRRVEERFAGVRYVSKSSILQSYTSLNEPHSFIESFFKTYPEANEQLLASEDKAFFLAITQRPGQKPAPFIPVLDATFEVWFKKDSLWAAEDIEAVFDQDPQRVCVLQGPVAAKHALKKDEPIKELLGNVEATLIDKVLAKFYGGDDSKLPCVDFIGGLPPRVSADVSLTGVEVTVAESSTTYKIGSPVPDATQWQEILAGLSPNWLRAFLTSVTIVQGTAYVDNPIRRVFLPRTGQTVVVCHDKGLPLSITVYGGARSFGPHNPKFKAIELTFETSSRKIVLTIFEERRETCIPLVFEFQYRPEQGFAPIHEIVLGRNKRIKAFYWKLWFGDDTDLPEIDIKGKFVGPEVVVDAQTVERFCAVVGNQSESFSTARNSTVNAPMDFAIVTGWQAIMQAIFPDSIDGDVLKLVHLSNGFRMIPGVRPLRANDVCRAEAKIISVTNSDSGKTVKVKGTVLRDGDPIIEVTSAFLYRGRFTDYANTFELVEEADYVVELKTDADIGVLLAKEWFQWDDAEHPLRVGTSLIFKTQSELTYKDKNTFSAVTVRGAAYSRNQLKQLKKMATVDSDVEQAHGNVVLGYLKRHGRPLDLPILFEGGGYTLTSTEHPALITAPLTNEPYSKISGDFNPIHINPYFSDYASLPGTITHGLWSSAATRKYVENVVGNGHPQRVLSYDVGFVGMVLPGDNLQVTLKHIGMRDGNLVVKVETVNERGEKILEGTTEVAQPTTAYVFTGQGSQEPGMGMELYANSSAARAVWENADAHLRAVYGFSIVDIVKNNPKSKTVHFGGIKGQAIRQRYMDMTYDTTDKDGNVKTLPLFADIDVRTPAYTFSHPAGLLFATQFAQIALVVTEKAAFDDMRSKGLVVNGCAFAGHSLGEYSALASIADVLPIAALVDVVFYRGITMQRAVERDAQNRSNYAMCAVNPGRISKTFNEAALREVVDCIATKGNILLEIVNYNVEGQQYVCAGELAALQALTNVLNYLKTEKVDIAKLTVTYSVEKVREMLIDIVQECLQRAQAQQKIEGHIQLERGFATIPLPGIDVPFHSRYLWAGVMPFRAYLSKKINPLHLDPDTLIGKYVPNLTAEPFEVTRAYAQRIYDQTSSPRLDKVLRNWDRDSWGSTEQRQKLAYVILVELLSYQFASAVRWIETQDRLFTQFNFERLIELGPGPTLTGMATRTLKAKYEASDDSVSHTRAIFCHAKNPKEIYYQFEDELEDASPEAVEESPSAPSIISNIPVPAVSAVAPSAGPAASIADEPLKAVDTLRVIVAQKLKKKFDEVPLSKSIKDLVGGKSTLQNEVLGDLQLEFASAPEKGEELPLDELGAALGVGYSGALGKYTSGLISRLVGGKMPGGFNMSAIKAYLSKTWGLGPARADGLLLLSLTLEPAKRFGSEAEAKTWLDSVAAAYAQQSGISLSSGGAAGAGTGGGPGGAIINSEEFLKFQAEQERFAGQQIEVYMRYLNRDSRAGERASDAAKDNLSDLQAKLDSIYREHGDLYVDGIQPMFEPLKARHFDSSWNWVRQDALLMWYDIIHGRLTTVDREITARCIAIMNRADPALLEYMQYHINTCDPSRGETYQLAKEFGQQLIDNCREAVGQPPLYKDVTFPTAPHTEVNAKGDIVYSEVVRESVRKLEAYVEEMASGDTIAGSINIQKVQDDVLKLWNVVKSQPGITQEQKGRIKGLYEGVVRSLRKGSEPRPRIGMRRSSSQFLRPQITGITSVSADKVPLLHLKRRVGTQWEYSSNLTSVYLDILTEIATSGTTFKDKNALLTGVGAGSIGVEVLKGLLSGGAHVVVTTSRYSRATVEYYQDIYQKFGARGSALTVVPFNQGSKQDVEALIDYIYATLSLDLDYILPFAAVPERDREIDGLDDRSELAHRIMLVNLLRLLGAVKTKKASRQFVTRPTQVILPLSPNHGLFGSDGLYSESKISLETLFNRWNSESWGEYLCLAGAVIGWTRGTGVMALTNIVAQQIEAQGVRTFSAKEMAFNLLGLMHPLLFSITQVEPIWADLNGGMDRLTDLADLTKRIRSSLNQQSELRRAITRDNSADFKITNGVEAERVLQSVPVIPRANFKFDFPKLESASALEQLSQLRGLIDLDQVVVVTGFAEVGPWGSSRTRWEMEAISEFTIEGCIEMAWIMGYIKYFDGRLKDGSLYVGWVDSKSGEPVDDKDAKGKYERDILAHAGVRLIEPELHKGYDPNKKVFYQEIELTHDLEPIEVSEIEAKKFKHLHGEKCDIWSKDGEQYFVKFKKGALVKVPKASRFTTLVAGQLPTGWYAGRYGIPEDLIAQTDRTALWALVSTAEALVMSGITDSYELYKYVHPSEVGTSLGSGMGGMTSLAAMFKDRREEMDVQKDILQETFINTVAGWVNMLLLSSSGPIKIPVGACATGLQSLDIACDTILRGKARVMIAGGFDDFCEEGSYEFANMKATSNSMKEFAAGREPTEFSRPTTSTRAGFMESQGCGVQVVMSAKLALEMGAPIRGIVAFTSTSSDKAGRSVPAPGRGVLSIGRQATETQPMPILDISYRARQLAFRRKQISQWISNEHELLHEEITLRRTQGESADQVYLASRQSDIEQEALRQEKAAQATYGLLEGVDSRVAPLRRALAVWGLKADDIGVISLHGTSTMANEANETHVYNDIFTLISRTPGNAVPAIAQKSLTGHAKGGSAAWQVNGLCQSVNSGIIPGNRNADNVDKDLREWEYLMFPSKPIHTDGITAGLMTSFGFGQVGGAALIVHPRHLFAVLEPSQYETYKQANRSRSLMSYKSMTEMMTSNSLVKVKDSAPYTADLEGSVLLNPLARTQLDKTGSYSYPKKLPTTRLIEDANVKVLSTLLDSQRDTAGVGVDQELISAIPSSNPTFVQRNFTEDEVSYCRAQPIPEASFAARWVGKEAVFKALGVPSKGAGAAMKDIEILPDGDGVPRVILHGDAKAAADVRKISTVHVSLSHSENVAIAFAAAQF